MKLIDTVVLVASINAKDRLHLRAQNHLNALKDDNETFVPAPALIEFELELKSHGFNEKERMTVYEDLLPVVPKDKVIAQSISSMAQALTLYVSGMSYFDSLIAAMAKEADATVITTDKVVANVVKTTW